MNSTYTWKPTKVAQRELHPYEAYVSVQTQLSLLKSYLWEMKLLTEQEQQSIRREIKNLSQWIIKHDYIVKQGIQFELTA